VPVTSRTCQDADVCTPEHARASSPLVTADLLLTPPLAHARASTPATPRHDPSSWKALSPSPPSTTSATVPPDASSSPLCLTTECCSESIVMIAVMPWTEPRPRLPPSQLQTPSPCSTSPCASDSIARYKRRPPQLQISTPFAFSRPRTPPLASPRLNFSRS
jgi:hypothetical protein